MSSQHSCRKLSCIETSWSTVYRAHHGEGDERVSAKQQLLKRYYHPIYRYLRAMVRDGDEAGELTHEFAVRFLRGDFRWADPSRGRFRDLLKRSLRHLAIDYWRRKRAEKERAPLPLWDAPKVIDWRRCPPAMRTDSAPVADWRRCPPPRRGPGDPAMADHTFARGWSAEMLSQAWESLARFEEETSSCYHTILRLRTEHPEGSSAELARLAGSRLGRPISEGAFRQVLRRAREKFADLLVAEVARTLDTRDPDVVEEELIELDLHSYCRRSVERMRRSNFLDPDSGA